MDEEAVKMARAFHAAYERLAPQFGYETRQETRDFDRSTPNGQLMVAVCREVVLSSIDAALAAERQRADKAAAERDGLRGALHQCAGMADEGMKAPNAAYRWCERIEEVCHAARPLPEYAQYARAALRQDDGGE